MDNAINAILVDDEAGCIDNLQYYLHAHCPRIKIIGTATDVTSAVALLTTAPVHIAFLDVHLFDRNIFEALPEIKQQQFSIVFVTAYEQYALSAFRVSALDYILKPLEKDEIIRCYEKIMHHYDTMAAHALAETMPRKVMLRQGDHVFIVDTENIILLKAQGFYTVVVFKQDDKLREMVISKPINIVHEEWNIPLLMRVHRSYAVNLKHVISARKISGNLSLQIGDTLVPVAKRRAADFLKHYNG